MSYKVKFLDNASKDALKLKQEEPKSFTKLMKMVDELKEHPMTGTGKPEYLKYDKRGVWSRRITQKHRLVYKIHNDVVVVEVVSAYGHYGEK
jgi:toxin YoeB